MKNLAGSLTHALLKWNGTKLAIAAALAAAMCCSGAFAQSGAGSIQGTITDSTGAVIPEASIEVVNTATAVASHTTSNNAGFYQAPDLFAGNYVVTVTAPEMQTHQRTVDLLVGQRAEINFSLTPGSVTQKVVVKADAVQLATTNSGTISSTLENSRIQQLPMNGRNILTLVQETTPGLENCSQSASCANGLMGPATSYVADGVPLNVREFGGQHQSSTQTPDPDSIQEVRVETTGSGAEFATPATGVITTKSGTNHVHGALFETARNSALGIARSRSNPSNFVAPHYVRNEFGISAGGPIVIPHVYNGKGKSFWFFAYERYSLRSNTYENVSVPTLAMRNGDFSGLTDSAGVPQQLYDPATTKPSANCNNTGTTNPYCRTPFFNNQIPMSRESPTAKILMDITPLPSNGNNPAIASNLATALPDDHTQPSITFRLDHVFDQNNRAYLRYTQNNSTSIGLRKGEPPTLAADGLPYAASGIAYSPDDLYAAALGYTHIFSPTLFAQTNISQQWYSEQNFAGGTPFANFEQQLGLPNNFGEPGFPSIGNIYSPFDGTQFQYGVTQLITNLDENLTKTLGNHQLLFGIRYRHERFGSRPDERKDSISFDGQATGLEDPTSGNNYSVTPATGNVNADAFLGAASSYGVNLQPPYQHIHDNEFDAYIQDNYRVRRNLTLNLGLRYEAHPAIAENGIMMGFDLKNDAVVTASTPAKLIAEGYTTQAIITNDERDGVKFETPAQAGMPSTLLKNYDFTFGPRIGVAWQPFGDKWGTVLRGAYGRFIYPVSIRNTFVTINRNNPFSVGYSRSFTSSAQSPDGLPNYLLRSPQSVVMGVNSSDVIDSSTTTSILPGLSIFNMNPDLPPTYVTQTNLTVEQPLPGNSVLRLSYLYTHGSNLEQDFYYNDHPSTYNWEMVHGIVPPTSQVIGSDQYSSTATGPYDQTTYGGGNYQLQKTGWSNYNGFQANYQRLFHHGLAYQISYVWSKSFRVGGNGGRDNTVVPYSTFVDTGLGKMSADYGPTMNPILPPPPPTNTPSWGYYRALNRFENYQVDTGSPKHHVQFNFIYDLPFGRGKRFLGNVNRFWNELVGGFQLAGSGSVVSQDFSITSTNWGSIHPLKVYKHSVPITDCRSGKCYKEYQWFNGYIPPTEIAGNPCAGSSTKVVYGLPADYQPYQSPIDTGCDASGHDKYFGKNEVNVTLLNGKTSAVNYQPYPTTNASSDAGANSFSHTVLNGPMNYNADLSLFKVFPITEGVNLRVNVDAFNAFNVQGYTNPSGTDGTEKIESGGVGASSYNTPRQIQLTARLTF